MFHQTISLLRTLCQDTLQPTRSLQAMQLCLENNLKLVKKTQTYNLLNSLLRRQLGTNEVEKYAAVVTGQCVRKTSGRGLVVAAMRHKVADSEWCVGQARYEYLCSKKNMYLFMIKEVFI